ncbi:MAG: hypothetical protein V6Z89_02445 [Desulfobacter sp.]
MNKREIIIVVAALVFAGYGLVDYVFLSKSTGDASRDNLGTRVAEIREFSTRETGRLVAIRSFSGDKTFPYLVSRLETPWEKDPFATQAPEDGITEDEDTGPLPDLVYSGFIRAGKRLMAIVNGMEYTTGDILNGTELRVKTITPTTVVLLTRANREVVLTLEGNRPQEH